MAGAGIFIKSLCWRSRFQIETLHGGAINRPFSAEGFMLDLAFLALGCVIIALTGAYAFGLMRALRETPWNTYSASPSPSRSASICSTPYFVQKNSEGTTMSLAGWIEIALTLALVVACRDPVQRPHQASSMRANALSSRRCSRRSSAASTDLPESTRSGSRAGSATRSRWSSFRSLASSRSTPCSACRTSCR